VNETGQPQRQFGKFTASELYCPKCKTAQPVRERLLLVLPSGELHEYLCAHCATSLGQREVTGMPAGHTPAPRHLARGRARMMRGRR
jgi:hypothetical protein